MLHFIGVEKSICSRVYDFPGSDQGVDGFSTA